MKILIAEDDYANRRFLLKFFSQYGDCDMLVDGQEALAAFVFAMDEGDPYDMVCLDIMMPKLDGLRTLKAINEFEKKNGVSKEKACKKFVITALDGSKEVEKAFDLGCEVYVTKPVNTEKLLEVLRKFKIEKKQEAI